MTATKEISPDGKSRGQIRYEIKEKERAVKYLSERYAKGSLSKEDIEMLLYSIGDNNSYLTFNRDPVRLPFLSAFVRLVLTHFARSTR